MAVSVRSTPLNRSTESVFARTFDAVCADSPVFLSKPAVDASFGQGNYMSRKH